MHLLTRNLCVFVMHLTLFTVLFDLLQRIAGTQLHVFPVLRGCFCLVSSGLVSSRLVSFRLVLSRLVLLVCLLLLARLARWYGVSSS